MAIDKLSLYNNALLLIGQRRLKTIGEERETRYLLDSAYDLGAVEYCLELVKPVFARKTVALTASGPNSQHNLGNDFALPSDYATLVKPYSDDLLDQEISRYIIEGNTLTCDYSTIYARYISDEDVTVFTNWSVTFANVVSAYLAREVCLKTSPSKYDDINGLFDKRIGIALDLDARLEPANRSSVSTVTLTNEWRKIYNDALFIMGLDEITQNNDDSNRKVKLDRALDADIVENMLEDTGWTFALTAKKSVYNPSLEPDWGYSRAHDKPSDMYRINGLYSDEFLRFPLAGYHDEGDKFFTDSDEMFVEYISSDWLNNPSAWPAYFRRLVAGRMAKDAAKSLRNEGADYDRASDEYDDRRSKAMSNDAMAAPPRKISEGSWVRARRSGRGSSSRRRP